MSQIRAARPWLGNLLSAEFMSRVEWRAVVARVIYRIHGRHPHPFNGPLSGTTQVSRYQKGKTNLDFTEARDSEWQWHQLGRMQVCITLQTDNHASTPPLSFLQAGCPSCRPTNSVKALKENRIHGNCRLFLCRFSRAEEGSGVLSGSRECVINGNLSALIGSAVSGELCRCVPGRGGAV